MQAKTATDPKAHHAVRIQRTRISAGLDSAAMRKSKTQLTRAVCWPARNRIYDATTTKNGAAVYDDRVLFEFLVLEGAQQVCRGSRF